MRENVYRETLGRSRLHETIRVNLFDGLDECLLNEAKIVLNPRGTSIAHFRTDMLAPGRSVHARGVSMHKLCLGSMDKKIPDLKQYL